MLAIDARDSGLDSGADCSWSMGTGLLSLDFFDLRWMSSVRSYSGCCPSTRRELLDLTYSFLGLGFVARSGAETVVSCCEVSTMKWYTVLITRWLSWSHKSIFEGTRVSFGMYLSSMLLAGLRSAFSGYLGSRGVSILT